MGQSTLDGILLDDSPVPKSERRRIEAAVEAAGGPSLWYNDDNTVSVWPMARGAIRPCWELCGDCAHWSDGCGQGAPDVSECQYRKA